MKLIHALPPLAALAVSAAFLTREHFAAAETRATVTVYREAIHQITEHRAKKQAAVTADIAAREAAKNGENGGSGEAGAKAATAGGSIDLQELARLIAGMRRGGPPDMKAMMKLQKAMLELSPEALSGLISDAAKMEMTAQEREGVMMMLVQGLAQRDPKAAVLAATDYLREGASGEGRMVTTMNLQHAFAAWAKKDPAEALRRYDAEVAAGTFENKGLSEVNEQRAAFESTVLETLSEKGSAAARERLLTLPEAERAAVLSRANGFAETAEKQKEFAALVRETLPPDKQGEALKGLTGAVLRGGELERVGDFMREIAATPEEKNTILPEAAEASLRHRVWSGAEKPNAENTAALRTWLAEQAPEQADATLGKSLASISNYGAHFKPEQAMALVTELHATQPSDDLLESYLENTRAGPNNVPASSFEALAEKIQNPDRRALVLKKLTERK